MRSFTVTYLANGVERVLPIRRCKDVDDAHQKVIDYVRWHHDCDPEIISAVDICGDMGSQGEKTIDQWQPL